ncbi:MAG: methyltransferase [Akkermansiaceae bacterium]|nr:methyltransferase [Akkermansiaceae bacterium]
MSDPALETLMLALDGGDFPRGEGLFLGARPHPALDGWKGLSGWQPLKPLADSWEKAGHSGSAEPPGGRWPLVLFLPGKARDEILHGFALARDRLADGGVLLVSMANDEGAARFEKELAAATGGVTSIQKHKCRAFHVRNDGVWDEARFEEWRQLGGFHPVPDTNHVTQAGVFSHGRVDAGSALLARHLPRGLSGKIADLGAGWGFLSAELLSTSPGISRIDLYEADARALECARLNLASHSGCEIGFHWHDVTTGIGNGYDGVIMNPPFHRGSGTDLELGRDFLRAGAAALRRGGRMFLVANRQLAYESCLGELRMAWRKLAEDATYKVIAATAP